MTPSAAIAEVCEVNPRHQKGIDPTDSVAFVGMADLDAVAAIATDSHQRPFAEVAKGYSPLMNGDILVAKITPCFENCKIGQASTSTDIAAGSTEFHVLRPGERLDRRYLLHFLRQSWIRELGELRMTGSGGQRRVPERLMEELKIPLPLIEEQRRIAAVLDVADDLRTKRRQAIAKLDTLTQAIFIDMFGDTSQPSAEQMPFGDFLTDLRNGISPSKSGAVKADVLTLSAITGDSFDGSAMKSSTFVKEHDPNKTVSTKAFLICRGNGNVRLVGRGQWPSADMPSVAFPDTMIAASVDPSRLLPHYLRQVWNSGLVRRQLERQARTTNGTFKINQEMISAIQIPCAQIEKQRTFSEACEAHMSLKEAHYRQHKELDTLLASLQQRAFAGEL